MERSYAGFLGILAFVTAIAQGYLHGGAPETVLFHAWMCLLAFAMVGYVAASIAGRTVDESVRWRVMAEIAEREAARTAKPGKPRA